MSSAEWGSLKRRSSAPQINGHGIFTLPLKETLSHTIISFLLHHTDTMEAKQFALSPMFVQVRKEHNHIYNMIPSVSLSDGLFEFSKRTIQNVLFCSGITLYFPEFIKLSSFSKSHCSVANQKGLSLFCTTHRFKFSANLRKRQHCTSSLSAS